MKKIAVVLSGCGNKDGSEIHESVGLIINLSQLGASVRYFAPSIEFTPTHFLTNQKMKEHRNVMLESARITRSQIEDIANLNAEDFDGLALPGGFGAALHLSNWADRGVNCDVNPHLEKAIVDFHKQSKPIAAICIAPTIVARVLGKHHVTLTVGEDSETSKAVEKTGAIHEVCPVEDYVTDRHHKVITTPAYMYDAKPHEVFKGISGLAKEFMEMA